MSAYLTTWGERALASVGRVRCACGHDRASHSIRRRSCWSVACGCWEWRPADPDAPRSTLEAIYRGWVDAPHPDDPGPTPPEWAEQEWCDGGASCEHDGCLADAELEARTTGADS